MTPAFYPVTVSNRAGHSHGALCWGAACRSAGEARRAGKALVEAGLATLAFVVRLENGTRVPLPQYTHPKSAQRIIEHWLALGEAVSPGGVK